jgi:Raf kinase inhibitor-like YbhB/YbcL family protein
MLRRGSIFAGAVALAAVCGVHEASAQGVFALTSPSFKDGERLAVKNAGNNKANPNCVGENISPALNWANPPEGTKSYALLMFDPEGRPPGGVSHWVAYGIAPSVTGFAEGEVSKTSDKYVGGISTQKLPSYSGPCTPAGAPHHYTFTLIATDLEPAALKEGMTRDQGAGRPCQGRDRPDRHVLQAVRQALSSRRTPGPIRRVLSFGRWG